MKLRRNIALGTGLLLVLLLGITMICGGCKGKDAEWNYTPNYNTTGSTGDTTTSERTDAFGDPTAPNADVSLEDKETLDSTTDSTTGTTTGGTTGGTTTGNTTGGTTDSTTGETTSPTDPSYDEDGYMTYESYMALTGPEQDAYRETFPTLKDFNAWFHAAKAAYDAEHPKETITDGNITLD